MKAKEVIRDRGRRCGRLDARLAMGIPRSASRSRLDDQTVLAARLSASRGDLARNKCWRVRAGAAREVADDGISLLAGYEFAAPSISYCRRRVHEVRLTRSVTAAIPLHLFARWPAQANRIPRRFSRKPLHAWRPWPELPPARPRLDLAERNRLNLLMTCWAPVSLVRTRCR